MGRGALRRRAGQHGAQRSHQHGRHPRQLLVLGRHRSHPPRRAHGVGWPRLRRHRADEDAAPAARASSRAGCRPAVPVHVRVGGGIPPRVRPGGRLRRHQLAGARRVRRCVPSRHRHAAVQVHLARHAPEVRRRAHLHLRGDRTRLDVGARLPVRLEHRDGDRGVHAADVGRMGLRADVEGGHRRHVRTGLREAPRRPCVDVECAPPARLGGVDELPA